MTGGRAQQQGNGGGGISEVGGRESEGRKEFAQQIPAAKKQEASNSARALRLAASDSPQHTASTSQPCHLYCLQLRLVVSGLQGVHQASWRHPLPVLRPQGTTEGDAAADADAATAAAAACTCCGADVSAPLLGSGDDVDEREGGGETEGSVLPRDGGGVAELQMGWTHSHA